MGIISILLFLNLALLLVALFILIVILLFPTKWDSIVEKENGFWVKKGLIEKSTAEIFIKFEKGKGLKFLLIFSIAISLFSLFLYFKYIN